MSDHVQEQVSKSLKLVGRVLGDKFRLTACIGIGGSGAVYKADQMALGRTVAVKLLNEELSADVRMIKRFRDEAMSASRLNHPNCVSIIDYGQAQDGLLYLAITQYLGFKKYGDEYKVMGLAPYGSPTQVEALSKLLSLEPEGGFSLSL